MNPGTGDLEIGPEAGRDLDWGVLDADAVKAPGGPRRLRVLLACNYQVNNAATVCDHINAFVRHSRHEMFVLSRTGDLFRDVDLRNFDAIIVHYSLFLALGSFVSPRAKRDLAAFPGLKVAFIQDEYRFVDATMAALAECGVRVVFTCVPAAAVPEVYRDPSMAAVRFEQVLTGYVPEWLLAYPPRPLRARRVMVGYRGRDYPAWHGPAGREKVEIGRRFKIDARRHRLRTDIAWTEKSRLYGAAWTDFLRRCRAVLAVESGASVFDFDGTVAARTENYAALTRKPGEKADREAAYYVLRERFFAGLEDRIDLAQISPRVFEAIALRTLVIAYRGAYSGVMQPWRHYIPLEKDHSNMDEVVVAVRDVDRASQMVTDAFVEVAMNPRYAFAALLAHVDRVLDEEAATKPAATAATYRPAEFHRVFHFYMVDNPYGYVAGSRAPLARATRLARRAYGGVARRLGLAA